MKTNFLENIHPKRAYVIGQALQVLKESSDYCLVLDDLIEKQDPTVRQKFPEQYKLMLTILLLLSYDLDTKAFVYHEVIASQVLDGRDFKMISEEIAQELIEELINVVQKKRGRSITVLQLVELTAICVINEVQDYEYAKIPVVAK